jgi:hypothetical protein
MKYAVEMSSGVMIYIPYWLRHSKVNGGDTLMHRQHGDRISLFFLIKNVG